MEHPTKPKVQAARVRAADMFAKDLSNADIGRCLGVARQTVSRWKQTWRKQGSSGLKLSKRGPKPRLTDEQWRSILSQLLLGATAKGYDTDLWTLDRIADLIEKETGISLCPTRVWQLLKSSGWSCQKPETRAKERKEEAIEHWKSHEWPSIKKKRKNAMQL